jgi:hypothetical protein
MKIRNFLFIYFFLFCFFISKKLKITTDKTALVKSHRLSQAQSRSIPRVRRMGPKVFSDGMGRNGPASERYAEEKKLKKKKKKKILYMVTLDRVTIYSR